jgi:tRNA dimethylallyltransferase
MTESYLKSKNPLIVVLGHTAGGKTAFAAALARKVGGEIISADSRQVYRGMDIGTGKDYDDYLVDNERIPAHLIDIVDPGYEYSVFEFQKDFLTAFNDIRQRNRIPFLCGGTGLYLQAVLKEYELISVPPNETLRNDLSLKTIPELTDMLASFRPLHNTTDIENRKRLIRAIEIEMFKKDNPSLSIDFPEFTPVVLGIHYEREERRRRITERLKARLEGGMIQEAENLLASGITPAQLEFYGLEYKYLSWYITGKISYDEMFEGLNTAIHQFAKRQMTWFRKMEREGIRIHWIEGEKSMEEKV